jgi:hypothetical protein
MARFGQRLCFLAARMMVMMMRAAMRMGMPGDAFGRLRAA